MSVINWKFTTPERKNIKEYGIKTLNEIEFINLF